MGARIILAVAGAGKTYSICDGLPREGKSLILAFTNSNIKNIVHELELAWKRKYKAVLPETIKVMTFDSFVYRYCIAPYLNTISAFFGCANGKIGGVTVMDPPTIERRLPGGSSIRRPKYNKDNLLHYIDGQGRFYVQNMTELICYVKKRGLSLLRKVTDATNIFWEHVLIDEFQDFREFDSEFIQKWARKLNDVVLVGDYYQHSVAAKGNAGKPFKIKKRMVDYTTFVGGLQNQGFIVDVKSLSKSRRCPECVCEFIRNKLKISISSISDEPGSVHWVGMNEAEEILSNDDVVKLVEKNAKECPFNAINWSYSKGDTYQKVCVILTTNLDHLKTSAIDPSISVITKNKLYVALTRTASELYLMPYSVFKDWKQNNREEKKTTPSVLKVATPCI